MVENINAQIQIITQKCVNVLGGNNENESEIEKINHQIYTINTEILEIACKHLSIDEVNAIAQRAMQISKICINELQVREDERASTMDK